MERRLSIEELHEIYPLRKWVHVRHYTRPWEYQIRRMPNNTFDVRCDMNEPVSRGTEAAYVYAEFYIAEKEKP